MKKTKMQKLMSSTNMLLQGRRILALLLVAAMVFTTFEIAGLGGNADEVVAATVDQPTSSGSIRAVLDTFDEMRSYKKDLTKGLGDKDNPLFILEIVPHECCAEIGYFIGGEISIGWQILALTLFLQLIRRLLEPKLMSNSMSISPLESLIGMFVGLQAGGIVGLIGGPVAMAVLVGAVRGKIFESMRQDARMVAAYFKRRWAKDPSLIGDNEATEDPSPSDNNEVTENADRQNDQDKVTDPE